MLGAIAGDVIGSVYERRGLKTTNFPLFSSRSRPTDDTVMTVATARAILTGVPYERAYHEFGNRFPHAGYGGAFRRWLASPDLLPYGSWGNGSAMRVSPIGFAFDSVERVLAEAERSAAVTHGHAEGVKGAQAVALAVLLARTGASKTEIREELTRRFAYDLDRTVDEIRPGYHFEVSCQGSVPEAIVAFLDSRDVEDAIRLAISLGGDADTQASIAGAVAHAFYGEVPSELAAPVRARLPGELLQILDEFERNFPR